MSNKLPEKAVKPEMLFMVLATIKKIKYFRITKIKYFGIHLIKDVKDLY